MKHLLPFAFLRFVAKSPCVRASASLFCAAFLAGCASMNEPKPGAQQEKTLEERLLAPPDANQVNRYEGQEFVGSRKFQSRKFALKKYEGAREMPTESFISRAFGGTKKANQQKTAAIADSAYVTDAARGTERAYASDAFATSTYGQADRSTQVKGGEVRTPTTKVEAQAQGRLDVISKEISGKLTIDEIREMLNKPQ